MSLREGPTRCQSPQPTVTLSRCALLNSDDGNVRPVLYTEPHPAMLSVLKAAPDRPPSRRGVTRITMASGADWRAHRNLSYPPPYSPSGVTAFQEKH
ncbi:hypothetical protein GCM10018783_51330 [Streptomyces griseosporeus]|nr:hypothetical protein GCM10018783_51330 [Streptomyces griseosporeus]